MGEQHPLQPSFPIELLERIVFLLAPPMSPQPTIDERVYTPTRLASRGLRQLMDKHHGEHLFNTMAQGLLEDLHSQLECQALDEVKRVEIPEGAKPWLPQVSALVFTGERLPFGWRSREQNELEMLLMDDVLDLLPNLRSLSIRTCMLRRLPTLANCPRLETVVLEQVLTQSTSEDWARLVENLVGKPSLHTLVISGCMQPSDTLALHQLKALRRLVLSESWTGHVVALVSLGLSLETTKIEELELASCEINNNGLQCLADQLQSNTVLRKLDLGGRSRFSAESAQRFADLYWQSSTRERLRIRYLEERVEAGDAGVASTRDAGHG